MTEPGTRAFSLTRLYLEELPPDRRQAVEPEIRGVIGIVEKLSDKLDLLHDVNLDVILTTNMGPHVDAISRRYGIAAVDSYDPRRNTVAAHGITLTDQNLSPFRVTIVLNQESWTVDSGENIVLRSYLLLHEVGHVLQRARRTESGETRTDQSAATFAKQLAYDSRILWNEFDADVIADQVCRDFLLRTEEGKPIGAGEFLVERLAGCAADLLDKLCAFVEEDVEFYRLRLAPLDPLYPKAYDLIRELLRVLTHAAALSVGMNNVKNLTTALEGLRGFKEFILQDWQPLLNSLAEDSDSAAESEITRIWNAILRRLGLEIEDLPDGSMYVHVSEPVFCCKAVVTDRIDSGGAVSSSQ